MPPETAPRIGGRRAGSLARDCAACQGSRRDRPGLPACPPRAAGVCCYHSLGGGGPPSGSAVHPSGRGLLRLRPFLVVWPLRTLRQERPGPAQDRTHVLCGARYVRGSLPPRLGGRGVRKPAAQDGPDRGKVPGRAGSTRARPCASERGDHLD